MEPELRLEVLGRPVVLRNGVPVTAQVPAKGIALLAYVAMTPGQHARADLADLLWGELGRERALSNLRLTLLRLRRVLGTCLVVSRDGIAPVGRDLLYTDAAALLEALAAGADTVRQRDALGLYKGELLAGVDLHEAPEFEGWLRDQRRRIADLACRALCRLAELDAEAGARDSAIDLLARALALEPWNEELHCRRMRLLAESGRRSAALAQFHACRAALAEELATAPAASTLALVAAIEAGQIAIAPPAEWPAPAHRPSADAPGLCGDGVPALLTPLFGRENEFARAADLLRNPHCRVLSVLGPGGIGKTAFAIALAQCLGADYPGGIHFVSFVGMRVADPAAAADYVLARIADCLGTALPGQGVQRRGLLERIAGQEALVVLDNFESARSAAPLLEELTRQQARIRLLVTTRVRLGLGVEWLFPLEPLPVPVAGSGVGAEPTASVALFLAHARRFDPGFDPEREPAAIAEIARLMEGYPLATMLAANWIRVFPAAEVARRLRTQTAQDLLRTAVDSSRHGSIDRVLEQAWSMLEPDQQRVLAMLSVFRGGFTPDAACVVAQTGPATLACLCDRTLLHRRGDRRLGLHELQRQHASDKLDAAAAQAAAARHARYYVEWARAMHAELATGTNRESAGSIAAEIDNLCSAHTWLLANGAPETMVEITDALWSCLRGANDLARARDILAASCRRADVGAIACARWLSWISIAEYSQGRLEQAREATVRAVGIANHRVPDTRRGWMTTLVCEAVRQFAHRLLPAAAVRAGGEHRERHRAAALAVGGLGQIAFMQELPLEMLVAGFMELNCAERAGAANELAHAYSGAAIMFGSMGLQKIASRYARRCESVLAGAVDRENSAYALEVLGLYRIGIGAWTPADADLSTAAQRFGDLGLPRAASECWQLRAAIPFRLGDMPEARCRWQRVLAHALDRQVPFGEFWARVSLAKVAMRLRGMADDAALSDLQAAESLAAGRLGVAEAIEAHGNLARCRFERGEYDAALDHALAGLRCMRMSTLAAPYNIDGCTGIAETLLDLVEAGAGAGTRGPRAALDEACRVIGAIASRIPIARPYACYLQGRFERIRGRHRAAKRWWLRGVDAARRLGMPYEESLCGAAIGSAAPGGKAAHDAARAQLRLSAQDAGADAAHSAGRSTESS
ncbi:MAG: BTAD domain-containing putative transcriptional regulator [Gammaproteobacteria bacterium]